MGANQKLNAAHVGGAILGAALLGWLTGSVVVFGTALIVLLAISVYLGEIRR